MRHLNWHIQDYFAYICDDLYYGDNVTYNIFYLIFRAI